MDLITKYNRPGPRYTSYPAYPHWDNKPSDQDWINELHQYRDLRVDLYLHIPYCQSLCTYCGCTRTISKNLDKGMDYTALLLKEWRLYKEEFPHLTIDSLHFGGGTPTFLRPEYLRAILDNLEGSFSESFSGAAEIDPRVTSIQHLNVLKDFGINRLSLGIQDFDPLVQKICNRIQPPEMVRSFLKDVRALEIENINFDLIYGLPGQSLSSIEETIGIVKEMKPTTIALYGYAHVPWRSKAQKSLERYKIAAGEEKRALYERSKELLLDVGYRELGLDHFALEGSELMSAYERGELKRTFMGYTAQKAPVTLGLGASAISSSPRTFVQNEKEVKNYSEKLARDKLPLFNGHILSLRDQACSQVIQSIMCQGKAEYENLFNLLGDIERETLLGELQELFEDGLIEYNAKSLRVLERGKPFLRNISMIFDHRLTKVQNQFSKTV